MAEDAQPDIGERVCITMQTSVLNRFMSFPDKLPIAEFDCWL